MFLRVGRLLLCVYLGKIRDVRRLRSQSPHLRLCQSDNASAVAEFRPCVRYRQMSFIRRC